MHRPETLNSCPNKSISLKIRKISVQQKPSPKPLRIHQGTPPRALEQPNSSKT